jgi:hypothetical protein
MICVSDEVFEVVLARAKKVGEEVFRRLVFDTNMIPEAQAVVRDGVVYRAAELWVEDVARAAHEYARGISN